MVGLNDTKTDFRLFLETKRPLDYKIKFRFSDLMLFMFFLKIRCIVFNLGYCFRLFRYDITLEVVEITVQVLCLGTMLLADSRSWCYFTFLRPFRFEENKVSTI